MIMQFEKPATYPQFIRNLLPSVMTMIFLSFYTTIDGFFVSRFAGSDALAGINIVIPVTCVIFGVAVMLATGAGAIIGEKMGRGEEKEVHRIFSMICLVLLGFCVVFTVLGLVFLKDISRLLGASDRLMEHVLPYAGVIFAGAIPMAFKLFFEYMVRTDGNPKVALFMSGSGLVLNVLLDALLVGGLQMGTLGAALGTLLSITVSAGIGLVYFLTKSRIHFGKPDFNQRILLRSCANGSSEMFTEFSTGITTFLFNIMIFRFYGEDGVAAITIIMYIYYFFIAFYMGISVATAPVISYNVGSGNSRKIRETLRYSFLTIGATSAIVLSLCYLLGPAIIGLFSEPGQVFDITWAGLQIFGLVFVFIGMNVFLSGYFTALGNGLISAVISLLRSLFLVVLFILLLPRWMGVSGIWAAMPLAEWVTVAAAVFLYRKYGRIWVKTGREALSDRIRPVRRKAAEIEE